MNVQINPQLIAYGIDAILIGLFIWFYVYCLLWSFKNLGDGNGQTDPRHGIAIFGLIIVVVVICLCSVSQICALHQGYWFFWQWWNS